MARPVKERMICPRIQGYCFRGENGMLPVEIRLDELEALRWCDLEERPQEDAAQAMKVSRGTLQRLLYSAHQKIAFALLYGRTIRTEGSALSGTCEKKYCRFCSGKFCHHHKRGEKRMKIAITCEHNQVFPHFGHTPEFAVFTAEEGKVVSKTLLNCGDTGHGALAGLLQKEGIELLICGGIGGGAQIALAEAGIRLIGGASGSVDEVISTYLNGKLEINPDFQCHHHGHETTHSCGPHGCGNGRCH